MMPVSDINAVVGGLLRDLALHKRRSQRCSATSVRQPPFWLSTLP